MYSLHNFMVSDSIFLFNIIIQNRNLKYFLKLLTITFLYVKYSSKIYIYSGNALIPPNFTGQFVQGQFGPQTSPIPQPTSPRNHPSPTAIFQQPIVYWSYPNSPMSPTFFGPLQMQHNAYTHFSPNLPADSRPPTLVS